MIKTNDQQEISTETPNPNNIILKTMKTIEPLAKTALSSKKHQKNTICKAMQQDRKFLDTHSDSVNSKPIPVTENSQSKSNNTVYPVLNSIKNDLANQMITSKQFERKIIDMINPILNKRLCDVKIEINDIFSNIINDNMKISLQRNNCELNQLIEKKFENFELKQNVRHRLIEDKFDDFDSNFIKASSLEKIQKEEQGSNIKPIKDDIVKIENKNSDAIENCKKDIMNHMNGNINKQKKELDNKINFIKNNCKEVKDILDQLAIDQESNYKKNKNDYSEISGKVDKFFNKQNIKVNAQIIKLKKDYEGLDLAVKELNQNLGENGVQIVRELVQKCEDGKMNLKDDNEQRFDVINKQISDIHNLIDYQKNSNNSKSGQQIYEGYAKNDFYQDINDFTKNIESVDYNKINSIELCDNFIRKQSKYQKNVQQQLAAVEQKKQGQNTETKDFDPDDNFDMEATATGPILKKNPIVDNELKNQFSPVIEKNEDLEKKLNNNKSSDAIVIGDSDFQLHYKSATCYSLEDLTVKNIFSKNKSNESETMVSQTDPSSPVKPQDTEESEKHTQNLQTQIEKCNFSKKLRNNIVNIGIDQTQLKKNDNNNSQMPTNSTNEIEQVQHTHSQQSFNQNHETTLSENQQMETTGSTESYPPKQMEELFAEFGRNPHVRPKKDNTNSDVQNVIDDDFCSEIIYNNQRASLDRDIKITSPKNLVESPKRKLTDQLSNKLRQGSKSDKSLKQVYSNSGSNQLEALHFFSKEDSAGQQLNNSNLLDCLDDNYSKPDLDDSHLSNSRVDLDNSRLSKKSLLRVRNNLSICNSIGNMNTNKISKNINTDKILSEDGDDNDEVEMLLNDDGKPFLALIKKTRVPD